MAKNSKKTNSKKINVLRTKTGWFICIILAALFPFIVRIIKWIPVNQELPHFWRSEIDILAFNVAVIVGTFVEVQNGKDDTYSFGKLVFGKMGVSLCLGVLLLFNGLLLGESMDFERSKIQYEEEKVGILMPLADTLKTHTHNSLPVYERKRLDILESKIEDVEDNKAGYFMASSLIAFVTIIVSYKLIFRKEETT